MATILDPIGGTPGLGEAPIDATPYSRQDASWISAGGGGGGAYTDTLVYSGNVANVSSATFQLPSGQFDEIIISGKLQGKTNSSSVRVTLTTSADVAQSQNPIQKYWRSVTAGEEALTNPVVAFALVSDDIHADNPMWFKMHILIDTAVSGASTFFPFACESSQYSSGLRSFRSMGVLLFATTDLGDAPKITLSTGDTFNATAANTAITIVARKHGA